MIDHFLFNDFSYLLSLLLLKNFRLQQDSNSDHQTRRRARWPLDHHHVPDRSFVTFWAMSGQLQRPAVACSLILSSSVIRLGYFKRLWTQIFFQSWPKCLAISVQFLKNFTFLVKPAFGDNYWTDLGCFLFQHLVTFLPSLAHVALQ